MKTLFIVNPRSGIRRRAGLAAIIREACEAAAVEHEVITCEETAQLDGIIARAAAGGCEAVFAAGGDGTVHEVAKRLIGSGLALGILPIGSGNGLARHLGIPLRPSEALSVCGEGLLATIDTATVNGEAWVGVMGVGLDAVIAEHFASSKVRGLRTYLRVGLPAFARFRPDEYEIDVDGATRRVRACVVAVANSSQYGNNARVAPLASLQDGLLDVVIIEQVPLHAAPFMLARLFNGTLHESRRVKVVQGRRITIRRSGRGPAHVDGEPLTLPAELDVRVRPRSLRVLLPQRSGSANSWRI
ncbi:MAG TPA: YegS/Rv2252/BmrU family lipid kinase [Thermoanaerobaculia bacterium]|nr:YegS/Rv2252/BmrU family lipid kinase [Thermoanaerobaculia bacterium]